MTSTRKGHYIVLGCLVVLGITWVISGNRMIEPIMVIFAAIFARYPDREERD